MKSAIDLYSGIGGWTLGMKLSGIKNVASFEWWKEANETHNKNFGTSHEEVNIREINVKKDLSQFKNIDFVVGSPPCTQFSFSNKGGNGDIQDGLVDVKKFLEIVAFLKPKYWAMENVPRVAGILESELNDGCLRKFRYLVTTIEVFKASDFGVPQNRKRMIAGNFPVDLFKSYRKHINHSTLEQVLKSLKGRIIIDSNYGYEIARKDITELKNEADLTEDEVRINHDSKSYHPVYNKMFFPDRQDRASRTITATCTRVSRESIIVKSKNGYRRLNVRERGVLQGFPITFQFYGNSLNSKFKMIGNAVPPVLTYYVFQSMLEIQSDDLKKVRESSYVHTQPKSNPPISNLELPKRKYPSKRKFKFSVPHLRYGSGVRFELSNNPKSETTPWSFKFIYGTSKNIKTIPLNQNTLDALGPYFDSKQKKVFCDYQKQLLTTSNDYSSELLQKLWISKESNLEVLSYLDEVGNIIKKLIGTIKFRNIDSKHIEGLIGVPSKKLADNKESLFIGLYFLSLINIKTFKQ